MFVTLIEKKFSYDTKKYDPEKEKIMKYTSSNFNISTI
jgi:hypothetical protein